MKKSKKFYLGRVEESEYYEVGKYKGEWDKNTGFMGDGYLAGFCPEIFEELKIKLKPGQVIAVRLVEEK